MRLCSIPVSEVVGQGLRGRSEIVQDHIERQKDQSNAALQSIECLSKTISGNDRYEGESRARAEEEKI